MLIVGSIAMDSVTTPFGTRDDILGGSATYSGISASYFTDVGIVAVVGTDFPVEHSNLLLNKDIDMSGVERKDGRTFRWKGKYNVDMNSRTTLDTQLNVFADFDPQLSSEQRKEAYLFLGNIDPDLQYSVLEQMDHPKFVACDTMNLWIKTKPESLLKTLRNINLLIINDEEARMLAESANVLQAAKKILKMGPEHLVIKRGEYGAMLFGPHTLFCSAAFPVENVLDPTGAGDSFAGGLMGYLASMGAEDELALRKAVAYGTVMASYSVTDFGPKRLTELTFTEISTRYREFCKTMLFEDFDTNVGYSFNIHT